MAREAEDSDSSSSSGMSVPHSCLDDWSPSSPRFRLPVRLPIKRSQSSVPSSAATLWGSSSASEAVPPTRSTPSPSAPSDSPLPCNSAMMDKQLQAACKHFSLIPAWHIYVQSISRVTFIKFDHRDCVRIHVKTVVVQFSTPQKKIVCAREQHMIQPLPFVPLGLVPWY